MTERRWPHDDPYPERTPWPPRKPEFVDGDMVLPPINWRPSWWQRLLARIVGVRF